MNPFPVLFQHLGEHPIQRTFVGIALSIICALTLIAAGFFKQFPLELTIGYAGMTLVPLTFLVHSLLAMVCASYSRLPNNNSTIAVGFIVCVACLVVLAVEIAMVVD